ncbi:MAG: TRAP transporter substrate-binding protein [Rhizobiaceae bacterium]
MSAFDGRFGRSLGYSIKVLLIALTPFGVLLGQATAQDVVNLRMATVHNEGKYLDGQKKFVRLVDERTGGSVKIELFCCSQLGGERQIADGVSLGSIDMAVLGATGAEALNLLFMPFLFRDKEHALSVVNGDVGQTLREKYHDETGNRLIGFVLQGTREFLTNGRAIRTPDDIRGMKIRAPELPVVVASLKALGASAAVVPFPELYLALQQGAVDGWEGPVNVMHDAKHWEVAKFLSRASWIHDFNYLIASDATWGRITPDDQKVVTDTWREVAAEITANLAAGLDETYQRFTDNGVEVVVVDSAPFRELTKDVWKDFAPRIWGDGTYEAIQAAK